MSHLAIQKDQTLEFQARGLLFENLQDVFYRADNDGNIVLVSPSCENVFGYTTDQTIGLNLGRDLYANPQQRKNFLAIILKQGYVENYEIHLRRQDGTMIWGNVNSHFYYDKFLFLLPFLQKNPDVNLSKQNQI